MTHTLLFSGHRVDDPDRPIPRFPPQCVEQARREIGAAIDQAITEHGKDHLIGIAGAASGGDILFHEECRARGIPTTIYLALPADQYAKESVNSAGPEWTQRFHRLIEQGPVRILRDRDEPLPAENLSIWQRGNLWMLHDALANGGEHLTLIALWNGTAGDGPGGTAHMFEEVGKGGGERVRVGAGTIFA